MQTIDFLNSVISPWANILGAIVGVLISLYTGLITYRYLEKNKKEEEEADLLDLIKLMEISDNISNDTKIIFDDFAQKNLLPKLIVMLNDNKVIKTKISSIKDFINNFNNISDEIRQNSTTLNKPFSLKYNPNMILELESQYNRAVRSSSNLDKINTLEKNIRKLSIFSIIIVIVLIASSLFNLFSFYTIGFLTYILSLILFLDLIFNVFKTSKLIFMSQKSFSIRNLQKQILVRVSLYGFLLIMSFLSFNSFILPKFKNQKLIGKTETNLNTLNKNNTNKLDQIIFESVNQKSLFPFSLTDYIVDSTYQKETRVLH